MTTPSDASQAVELPPMPEPDRSDSFRWWRSASMRNYARAAIAQNRAARAQAEPDAVISGALFDFLGFLTTHETRWKFSAYDDASPAVQALEQWAEKRGLILSEADVKGWRGARAQGAGEAVGERKWCDTCATAQTHHSKLRCDGCEKNGSMTNWGPR